MSNFYGGSTIIKGGKFASHDPADDGVRYTSPKKLLYATQTKTSKKNSFKAKKPQDPRKLLESARKTLLHTIIGQMLMGREAINCHIPKTTHPNLLDSLSAAGNPFAWAKNQTEFEILHEKKQKQRIERELRRKHKGKTTPVTVEVKRKKVMKVQPSHPPANKPEPTAEELYKSNRLTLIRKLVDQMIKRKGRLTVPRLDSRQMEELKTSGSPILWLKAQPEYEAVFKARYLAEHQATSPVSKKTAQHTRKKKKRGKKQKLVKDVVPSESKTKKGQPKKNGSGNTVTLTRSQRDQ